MTTTASIETDAQNTALTTTDQALVREIVKHVIAALDERDDKLLEPREVAEMLGRSRTWVYERSEELGAVRMGSGPKARIGFKRSEVQRFLSEQSEQHRRRNRRLGRLAGLRAAERPRGRRVATITSSDDPKNVVRESGTEG
jgi:predicted DNA-binding transcriptional regulator AlpA